MNNKKHGTPGKRLTSAAAALLFLGGCASLSEDAGFGAVQSLTRARLNQDIKWIRSDSDKQAAQAEITALLWNPLSAGSAVRVALLNNPGLQAIYSNLGIAEADLVQAGRLSNPGFSFARMERDNVFEYERKFVFDLFGLLTMPMRTQIETRRFEQAKLHVSGEVMRVAAETRRAYLAAVAAQQTMAYMGNVRTAAEAAAELAERMAKAGNWSKLDQARERSFHVEVVAQQARAKAAGFSARENLARLMGLRGADAQFKLPERLPDLPETPDEVANVEQTAISQRLDVQMAKQEVEGLAKSLGLTKATRFINVLDIGYLNNSETGLPNKTGYEIELQLPVFDWGDAKTAKAEAIYMQAVNRAAEIAVNATSQAREAYAGYRTAYDVAKHYRDELLPLHQKISEENMLRYNGMLISVFELLADARAQMASVNTYISAIHDFWVADTNLQMALGGTAASMGGISMADLGMPGGNGAGNQ